MKWFKRILAAFSFSLLLGCSSNLPEVHERIIVMDADSYQVMDSSWQTVKTMKRSRKTKDTFYNYRFANIDENGLAGPCIGYANAPIYYEMLDAESLDLRQVKLPVLSLNSFFASDEKLVAVDNRMVTVNFCETDLQGKELQKAGFVYNELPPQIFMDFQILPDPVNGGWYMLAFVIPNGAPANYAENHLLHLNDQFQIDGNTDIGVYNGGCISMDIDFNRNLAYVLQTTEGTDPATGEPGLSQNLHLVNLADGSVQTVYLGYSGSNGIILDQEEDQLIIRRTDFYKTDNVQFLLLDPDTMEMKTIEFDQSLLTDDLLQPIFSKQNGIYTVLFQKNLLLYDTDGNPVKHIDLASYGFDSARAVWIGPNAMQTLLNNE